MSFSWSEGRNFSGIAGEVLAAYRRTVFNTSGRLVYANAAQSCHGFTTRPSFAIADDATVALHNMEGTVTVEISEAIAVGGLCYAAASGRVAASGTVLEGICVQKGPAAGASGDLIEMLPIKLLSLKTQQTLLRSLRTRVTAANVNAGATLLAAIPGYKYRVHDVALISIGGNAAGATTVDILGTLTTSQKILAAAVAGLTQSTVLRAGATNATVLADGASFIPMDANAAITIGKTGGSLTGSTNIDVLLTYTIEE